MPTRVNAAGSRSQDRALSAVFCIRGYCGIAYGLLVAGRIQIRAGVGTTGGALAALSSRPWLMARVIEYCVGIIPLPFIRLLNAVGLLLEL